MEKTAPPAETGTPGAATSHPNVAQPPAAHAPDGAHDHRQPQHSGPIPQMESNVNMAAQSQPPTTYATPLNGLGKDPAVIDCPFCKQRTRTRVEEHSSSMTIITGIGIGCLCICLACLPCMLGWFQDVDHFCTNCNQRVAMVADGRPAQAIYPQENVPQQYSMGAPHQPYGQANPQQQQQPQQQPAVDQPAAQTPAPPPQYTQ